MNCICRSCEKQFPLLFTDYTEKGEPQKPSLEISSCLSGGIYRVEVKCPHCGDTVDLI